MCQCPKSLEVTSQLEIRTIDMKQIQYVKLDIHDSALLVIGHMPVPQKSCSDFPTCTIDNETNSSTTHYHTLNFVALFVFENRQTMRKRPEGQEKGERD